VADVDPARRLVERRESSLLSLFELSHELGVGLDPYAIAQRTLFNLMGHFGTTAAGLWLRPESAERIPVLLGAFGIGEERARAMGAVLEAHVLERELASGGATSIAESAGTPVARAALDLGFTLLAPVSAHGRWMGLVGLGARLDGEAYGPLDLEYLAAAAGMAGVALENARLYQGARESNRRLRESNQRLAELDRLKSEFLGNVNHELRTPLAVIVGYLDVLRATVTDGPSAEAVSVAAKHATKLEGLLENLLDFSRLEERALRLEIGAHDLGDLLRDFAAARRPEIASGLRQFALEIEEALPPARCDPRRLLQILGELVDNAVKFTLPGSRILLTAARREEAGERWLALALEDDGPGIAGDRLVATFEPFRQGDGSTTREAGGLGLGLALARRLAEAMDGRLDASSEPGVGSRFVVRLRAA